MLALLLLLIASTPAASAAPAPTPQLVIRHCVAANGVPVYTDQPCASVGARPLPQSRASTHARSHGEPRCATTLATLKSRVRAAFAAGNVNALSALMLWHGYTAASAQAKLARLASLVKQSVLAITTSRPPPPLPAPASRQPLDIGQVAASPTLTLLLAAPDAPTQVSFTVAARDGCLWLEP